MRSLSASSAFTHFNCVYVDSSKISLAELKTSAWYQIQMWAEYIIITIFSIINAIYIYGLYGLNLSYNWYRSILNLLTRLLIIFWKWSHGNIKWVYIWRHFQTYFRKSKKSVWSVIWISIWGIVDGTRYMRRNCGSLWTVSKRRPKICLIYLSPKLTITKTRPKSLYAWQQLAIRLENRWRSAKMRIWFKRLNLYSRTGAYMVKCKDLKTTYRRFRFHEVFLLRLLFVHLPFEI